MAYIEDIEKSLEVKEPGSFKLISSLGIAGLFSGIVLVGTFLYTNPMIIANKEAATQRAIFKVLPGCENFQTLTISDNEIKVMDEASSSENSSNSDPRVYAGFNGSGELVGFAIPGSEPGFQDVIAAMFGYNAADGAIIGFEVLESKETPGLGDKIFKDKDFQLNFTNLVIEPQIITVKKGEKTQPNQVEAITGATISSKAIVNLLNNTLESWKAPIDQYLSNSEIKPREDNE